jgi:hypothetical protein
VLPGRDQVLLKYAKTMGLDREYSAHSMRATYITTAQGERRGARRCAARRRAQRASTAKLYDRHGYIRSSADTWSEDLEVAVQPELCYREWVGCTGAASLDNLERFSGALWLVGCLEPSVKVFVQCDLSPFQIASQVTLSQSSCQIRLGFPHTAVDCPLW